MKPSKKFILVSLLILFVTNIGICQGKNYATNIKTEIAGDKMLITYDAIASLQTSFFEIILMITYNGKNVQPKSLYGDYGSKITPGTGKSIVWYFTNDFKDDIRNVVVDVFAYELNEKKEDIAEPLSVDQKHKTMRMVSPFAPIIGIRGGVNLSNMLIKENNDATNEDFKMKPGFHFGLTAEFPVKEMASFETGLLFSTKGTKVEENVYGIENEAKMNLNYLEIPLTAKVYFSKGNKRVFGLFGPYFGYGLSGKTTFKHTSGGVIDTENDTETEDIKWGSDEGDDLKRLDFGLTAGVGIDANPFQAGLTYSYGLANIYSDTDGGMKVNNKVVGLYIGMKFGTK